MGLNAEYEFRRYRAEVKSRSGMHITRPCALEVVVGFMTGQVPGP